MTVLAQLSIRPMRVKDIAKVSGMIKTMAAFFGDTAKVTHRDLLTYCFGRKRLAKILVARIDKKPVGFAITREWMNFYVGVKFCHIDFLFVEAKYRRTGIGAALIKATAQQATKAGCRRLSLDVGVDNPAARKFYEKLGFEKRGNISDHYRLSDAKLIFLANAEKQTRHDAGSSPA